MNIFHVAFCLVFLFKNIEAEYLTCILGNSSYPCENHGTQVGYCCDELVNGNCCFYTAWWDTWYFWMGIILAIILVVSVFPIIRNKCCGESRDTEQNHSTEAVDDPRRANEMELPEVTYYADALPTYEDVEAQGIPEEYLKYAEKGEANPGFEVSVEVE